MIFAHGGDISIAISKPFLKLIGYWVAADRDELSRRNLAVVYTVLAICIIGVISVIDLFHSMDNSSDMLYVICNLVTLALCLLKLFAILVHRTEFFNLIIYLQQKFLQSKYDLYEKAAVDTCKRKCNIYICCFAFFALATCFSYIFTALVANIGKNVSDRQLPFNMYIDIASVTPYFEIIFTIQSTCLLQTGVSYFCFDNILCIICLHASCQFRIVQYRLRNLNNMNDEEKRNENYSDNYYAAFKSSVQYHQALIMFCNKLAEVFNFFALYQVLIFSLLMCLDGYQIVMADVPFARRLTFIFHLTGCTVQLLMFTYCCDCLLRDSADVAASMYEAPWLRLPMDKHGRMLRKDLLFVIARSRLPCYLSAGGFSIISLETFIKVLSTAVSYFTLIRQSTETVEDL